VSRKREQQLEHWLVNIEDELRALKGSWRWRLGDRLVRIAERLLGRRPVPLATDRIDNILAAFHASRRMALLEDLREQAAGGARFGTALPASPITDYRPVLERDLAFSRAVHECIGQDAESGRRLEHALADADTVLAGLPLAFESEKAPLVSIVMPTWQREQLVGEAVRSVIEQSYTRWELLVCDDGSTDGTVGKLRELGDERIRILELEHAGAAAARNAGLAECRGELIFYLDSDNLWHPHYLARAVLAYLTHPGAQAVACNYLDVEFLESGLQLRDRWIDYSYERLAEQNFIDLNSFSHRRALYDAYGGFTPELPRRQDWDFLLKLLFRFDPLVIDEPMCLYRRKASWNQLTQTAQDGTARATEIIRTNLERHYRQGVLQPGLIARPRTVTVLVWDICRNHLSKAWNIAEALSADYDTQLIGFRFFDEEIFPPYRGVKPPFETRFFDGHDFPEFARTMGEALLAIRGDLIYCVKPRLPSLGLAMLANYHFGTPFICESNDLESGVTRPGEQRAQAMPPDPRMPEFLSPWSDHWTAWLEQGLREWPWRATHNSVHDAFLGGGCYRVMNLKDEQAFTPAPGMRERERARLDIAEDEFVLLFAGLPRRHKGIFELADFVRAGGHQRPLRLLIVASRASPEYTELKKQAGERVTVIEPQDRNAMAAIHAAADAVLLWLNPDIPASHHQMPFKMTDAIAMRVPVLASPVGDLTELAARDLIVPVPFGDTRALADAIADLQENPQTASERVERARQYYLRRFTYRALRDQFAVMERQIGFSGTTHPAAVRLAGQLNDYLRGLEER